MTTHTKLQSDAHRSDKSGSLKSSIKRSKPVFDPLIKKHAEWNTTDADVHGHYSLLAIPGMIATSSISTSCLKGSSFTPTQVLAGLGFWTQRHIGRESDGHCAAHSYMGLISFVHLAKFRIVCNLPFPKSKGVKGKVVRALT